jgi:hypothetical protein
MGLDGRDDISDDLVSEGSGFLSKLTNKIRIPLFALIIGLILGALLMHYYGEPLLNNQLVNPSDSLIKTNELLGKENDCLYSLLDNARTDVKKCSQTFVDSNALIR